MNFVRVGSCNGLLSNWLQGIAQISTDSFPVGPHCQWVITCVDCTDTHVVYYPVLCVCCDYFTLWSLASSLFTGTEQSLWCRPCSCWLRWRFSAWWPLVQLETAVALLQWLFRAGACTRTNHVFAIMRSLQCNQCQDSIRQINPNGFQSLRYSMYDYDFVKINIFELSWVESVCTCCYSHRARKFCLYLMQRQSISARSTQTTQLSKVIPNKYARFILCNSLLILWDATVLSGMSCVLIGYERFLYYALQSAVWLR